MGKPLWPWLANFHGLPSVAPLLLNCVGSIFIENGLPFSCVSRGLGSNVSTCDGPPSMYRKMTFFTFDAKCGGFGANGDRFAAPDSAAAALPAKSRSAKSAE